MLRPIAVSLSLPLQSIGKDAHAAAATHCEEDFAERGPAAGMNEIQLMRTPPSVIT